MTNTNTNTEYVTLGDFVHRVPGLNSRTVGRLERAGEFPAAIRLGRQGRRRWRREVIECWISRTLAGEAA